MAYLMSSSYRTGGYPVRSYGASAKQLAFLASLGYQGSQAISSREASALIDEALAAGMAAPRTPVAPAGSAPAPAAPAGARALVTETGMYRLADGRMFKVQQSKQSGNLYAKELVGTHGRRLVEVTGESVGFEFVYAPGAMASIAPSDKLSLEDAKAFGLKYAWCCVCAAPLSDATSVAAGVGPTCAKRLGIKREPVKRAAPLAALAA